MMDVLTLDVCFLANCGFIGSVLWEDVIVMMQNSLIQPENFFMNLLLINIPKFEGRMFVFEE
jgi:hypothetical protein